MENIELVELEALPTKLKQQTINSYRFYFRDIDYSHPQNHPELENPHENDWDWSNTKNKRRCSQLWQYWCRYWRICYI